MSVKDRRAYLGEYQRGHRLEQAAAQRRYIARIKIEVLTHYGNGKFACVRCGENRFPCLSIDHINGGGVAHRKVTKQGSHIYVWLKVNGFPEGYQTLCMNCQALKKSEREEYRRG